MKKYFKLLVVLFVLFLVTYSLFNKDHTTNKETTEIKNQEPQYVFGILVDSLNVYNETVKDGQTLGQILYCLLYTSPSPRDRLLSRMPSSA